MDPLYNSTYNDLSVKCEFIFPPLDSSEFLSIATSQGEASLSKNRVLSYVEELLNHYLRHTNEALII